jgi:hypothetical protein
MQSWWPVIGTQSILSSQPKAHFQDLGYQRVREGWDLNISPPPSSSPLKTGRAELG